MQSIAETCVRFDAAHLSINLVLEIAVPMFPTLKSFWLNGFTRTEYLVYRSRHPRKPGRENGPPIEQLLLFFFSGCYDLQRPLSD